MRQARLERGEGQADRRGEARVLDRIAAHAEEGRRDAAARQRRLDAAQRVLGRMVAAGAGWHLRHEAAFAGAAEFAREAGDILGLAGIQRPTGAPHEDVERARRVAQHDRVPLAGVVRPEGERVGFDRALGAAAEEGAERQHGDDQARSCRGNPGGNRHGRAIHHRCHRALSRR